MKKLLVLFLFLFIAASFASAELFITANPLGKGKSAFFGAGTSDQNYVNMSGASLTSVGAFGAYGITDKLDGYLQVGNMNSSGIAGMSVTGLGYGATFKYALLSEGVQLPISVAAGVGYKAISATTKITGLPDASSNSTVALAGSDVKRVIEISDDGGF